MLRKLVFMLLIASLALTASCVFGLTLSYYGNIDPDTPGVITPTEGFKLYAEYSSNNTKLGSVVDDPEALFGKAWRINDTDPAMNEVWRTPSYFDLGSTTGATIIARIKTMSDTDGGGNLGMAHNSFGAFAHWGGANGDLTEVLRNQSVTLTTPPADDDYHIIRLTGIGSSSTTSFVENFNTYPHGETLNRGLTGWWELESEDKDAGLAIMVDSGMARVYGGANNTCSRIMRVDPDVDGKITVTVAVERTATEFIDGWVYNLDFLATNASTTDETQVLAGWQGRATDVKGRVDNNETLIENGELQMGINILKAVIDVKNNYAEYFINDVSVGTVPCNPAAGNKLGYVRFTSFNDSRTTGVSLRFDDITGTGTPADVRTINMYVDDVLSHSLVATNQANVPNGTRTDNFVFGSGAGVQDVYIDWIVMTDEGAFAPGDDVAHFGRSLNDHAVVTSLADIATAPVGAMVALEDAQVTAIFMGAEGNIGFAVGDPQQYAGVRVVSSALVYIQNLVDVTGAISVVDGERVVIATSVIDTTVTAAEPIKPLAVSNKSAAGGASGIQPAMVDFANKITDKPSFEDTFTYLNGPLANQGGWSMDASEAFAVENGVLKMSAYTWDFDWDYPIQVSSFISASDLGTGQMSFKMKIKKGAGNGNFWYMRFYNVSGPAYNETFYLMGQGSAITGRVGAYATGLQNLTGGWDTVEARLSTTSSTVEFFFNGVSIGSSPVVITGPFAGIMLERPYHTADVGSYVYLDDLQIFPSPTMGTGLNTVGVLSTIYGRVTHVKSSTPATWDDYFYIDDGTGYVDGTVDGSAGNIGIRCRPSSKFFQLNGMPTAGQFVTVTGVMGAKNESNNNIRFFWTDSYSVVEEL